LQITASDILEFRWAPEIVRPDRFPLSQAVKLSNTL
jgi:hypothetical protein